MSTETLQTQISHLTQPEYIRMAQVTRLPDAWRVLSPKSKPEDWEHEGAESASALDAAMLGLVDLAPAALGWQVLSRCETLIDPALNSEERLQTITGLMALIPAALQAEGFQYLADLLIAGKVEITPCGIPTGIDRDRALDKGFFIV